MSLTGQVFHLLPYKKDVQEKFIPLFLLGDQVFKPDTVGPYETACVNAIRLTPKSPKGDFVIHNKNLCYRAVVPNGTSLFLYCLIKKKEV